MENLVWQLAHLHFRLNVVGEARSVSEFGIEYRYWVNGAIINEGEEVPTWPVDKPEPDTLAAVNAFFEEQRLAGNVVAVWREFPEFTVLPATEADPVYKEPARPARIMLIMRLHFMPWSAFKAAMEARV